jgi:NADH-ubiquinone oxidoreductase chain 2
MVLTSLLLLLFSNGLTTRPDTSILYSRIGLIIVFYSLVSAITSYNIIYLEKGISLYNGLFNVTSITHTFQIFIFIICGIILLVTAFYPRKKYVGNTTSLTNILFKKVNQYKNIINKASEQFTIIEYALIILFVMSGATLLLASGDLGSVYLCIELQSFSLYIISSMHRNSESSTGSALTYFLLGGLSSCFILLGIAIIYANSGLTNLDSIYHIIADTRFNDMGELLENGMLTTDYNTNIISEYTNNYLYFSLLLITVGFLFKIAAAPFHWWSPDVYDGVPTVVTMFIAILGKIAILILLAELIHYSYNLVNSYTSIYSWTTCIPLSCFLSLIIGTILGLTQTRIKRLLAYSTISHVGFILLALISNSVESYQAYLFYIIQYILTNLNVFLILLAIGFSLYLYYTNVAEYNNLSEKNNSPIQLISQLKGYFSINPGLALCLVITMFSFIGLPPLVGFFGKQMVLTSALEDNKTLLVITGILTSVIGAVYYLTVIKTIYFDNSEYKKSYIYTNISLANVFSITLAILNIIVILFILTPNEILNLCNLLSLIFFFDNV